MRAEFNNLYNAIMKTNYGQEVVIAMEKLEQKITEVEKRIECARRSNQDSNSVIMSLVNSYQDLGKTEEELTYGDFETLQRGVYDVDIALNFNDKEPIENNWYQLFDEPKQEELSNGGIPYRYCHHCSIKEEETVMGQVNGFWLCCDCHDETKDDEENVTRETLEKIPTSLCNDKYKYGVVDYVIAKLNEIDVDGETMQYIIEQVGMTDQMLRQLIMSNPESDTKDLLDEKIELSNKSVRGCIEI